jgi:endonuclease G
LGQAGNRAISSIENREFNNLIMELGASVEKLGETELGDNVIKRGRTTGVTHGEVTRIHTIAKIDYSGSIGKKVIGGFEIEIDPANPPENGGISMREIQDLYRCLSQVREGPQTLWQEYFSQGKRLEIPQNMQ